ncbi:family 20 glycosylhydrolase [Mucilaginibacter sp. E4BP6]|uniref:family 20 glycosylhydrolase n=1 Tax=Mucilaginibacter sp. E4BP6 TaxID=2723089 RepID=UPI0015CD24E3|nr:family 20 glycosylhydrolase [Mucilaginibacter sp. E4BP6]NYE68342.1 hexosaminidase [Mucilaginibacter sp. E4BP6]
MRRLLTLFFATIFSLQAFAQADNSKFDAHAINITWDVVQNNYLKTNHSLSALIITNNGKQTLPALGWKFYFNSARDIAPNTISGNATFAQINGDLFTLTPTATFPELKPGASVRVEFTGDPVVNFTDSPDGFYLVWDADPAHGYTLGDFKINPFNPLYAGLVTPAIIYNQNKVITDVPEAQLTKIFPTPVSYTETKGFFTLTNKVTITTDPGFNTEVIDMKNDLEKLFGKALQTSALSETIALKHVDGMGAEAYTLSVTPDRITISASTPAGIFYGIQSLKILIPASAYAHPQKIIKIPCVEVKDEPRFPYRAFVLDVARNFQTKQQVLKFLDAMALYKLNVLHFHLTDDEGWRIALPSLPELTEVSSERGHTLDNKHFLQPSHGSGPDTGKLAGSGHYSRADYIEILKYATARHIVVMPEIETPGHARSAVKAMDARYNRLMAEGKQAEASKYLLRDLNDKSVYSSVQDWTDNVIDVSLPSTYTFFATVIDDLIGIYKEAGAPLNTIHFGGDEVPPHVWERSPAYLVLKAAHPEITNTGDLWYYFYGNINQLLKARGLTLAGWEEMGLRKTLVDGKPDYVPNPDFTPYHLQTEVWNNAIGSGQEDLAFKLANAGYKVVLSSVTNLYFDMAHYKSFDEPGYYWGAFVDIDKPFSFIPYDYFKNTKVDRDGLPINKSIFIGKQRLTDYGKTNIAGLQGCLWGENIKTPERMEYMIFPSILGLAERAWAQNPQWATEPDTAKSEAMYQQAWSNFVNILGKSELPRLTYLNGGYGYRIPKPGVVLQDGRYLVNMQFPGFIIRYTTNGKDPDAKSKIYNDAVTLPPNGVKFRAFDTKGRGSNVSEVLLSN